MWVRNNPMVINFMISNLVLLPSVTSPEVGIRVLIYGGLLSERLRETFRTFDIFHTGSIWILRTSRSVNHELFDQFQQLWLLILIWKLCRKKGVNVFRSLQLLGDAPHHPTSPPIFLRHLCIFLLIIASPRRNALVAPIPESDDHVT